MEIVSTVGQTIADKVMSDVGKNTTPTRETDFSKLLAGQIDSSDKSSVKANQVMEAFGVTPEKQIGAISAEGLEIQTASVSSSQEIRSHGKVMDLLTEVNRGTLQMDDLMQMATSGIKMSPAQLLAGQACMAKMVFQLEMFGKITEVSTSAVKSTLERQV